MQLSKPREKKRKLYLYDYENHISSIFKKNEGKTMHQNPKKERKPPTYNLTIHDIERDQLYFSSLNLFQTLFDASLSDSSVVPPAVKLSAASLSSSALAPLSLLLDASMESEPGSGELPTV